MRVQARLERLERQVARCPAAPPAAVDLFTRIEQYAAYYRGDGPRPPDPPCPEWYDPAAWAERMRTKDEVLARTLGLKATNRPSLGE